MMMKMKKNNKIHDSPTLIILLKLAQYVYRNNNINHTIKRSYRDFIATFSSCSVNASYMYMVEASCSKDQPV